MSRLREGLRGFLGFFQDRLIKEMRFGGIKDCDSANKFLKEEFLPWYNKNYTREVESIYKEVSKGLDLNLIFSFKHFSQLLPINGLRSFDR